MRDPQRGSASAGDNDRIEHVRKDHRGKNQADDEEGRDRAPWSDNGETAGKCPQHSAMLLDLSGGLSLGEPPVFRDQSDNRINERTRQAPGHEDSQFA